MTLHKMIERKKHARKRGSERNASFSHVHFYVAMLNVLQSHEHFVHH